MQVPPMQVGGRNFARPGTMQGALRTQAGAVAYQLMPQTVLQTGTPEMMAPAYLNQMATTRAPVMLVPAQSMQPMPGTSGGGLMYVQVPANQVVSGSTQVSAPSQVPGSQFSEEIPILMALVLIIMGILDRVEVIDRYEFVALPISYVVMPVWTGILILITAGCGLAVGVKVQLAANSSLVLVYRSLNITCSFLCGFLFFWYGVGGVSVYAEKNAGDNKYIDDHSDDSYDYNFGVLTTIFVMALIELFLCILGTVASQDSSPNAQMQVPECNGFARAGAIETGFQIQACATAYQPVPQVASQANNPIMMVPAYVNQMATNNAPVMLVPAQNMQQEPATSGVGPMYVQVPLNQMLSGSTQVNAPSQFPGITSYSIRPQSPEEMQLTLF
ncbi:hypothetical protein OS493_031048 [Desmophyllum pertusum]|uniref:Uncharacterized protein n=1 Tax=Desmophyllum pertusum TaxID=174260 RepID=A0A9X0CQL7_9CNID|nr:hypothetical protein OS493_031048 [Desmophyllum pertusum]